MKKWRLLLPLLLLCGLFGGCAAQQITAIQGEYTAAEISSPERTEVEALASYASYGMSFDAKTRILTYDGQRVRYFEDLYPIVWNTPEDGVAGMTFFDEKGVVDVHATRDLSVRRENKDGSYDPAGTLTGLAAFSQTEFNARDLQPLIAPATNAATAGEPMTAAELEAIYAPYAAYGLTYDAKKDLFYLGGQQVRRFTDILSTNGEKPEGGNFKGSMTSRWDEGGTVDVRAVRDYAKLDADGYGRLTGIETATQVEFDAATNQIHENAPQFQFYCAGGTTVEVAQEG